MSRADALLFQLSFVVPLAALLLVSLGLVALKRRSGSSCWLARLTTASFYLVSLPIATLIVGAEMLGWYSLFVMGRLLSGGFSWNFRGIPFFLDPFSAIFALIPFVSFSVDASILFPLMFLADIGFFLSFWVATFVSGYLLWQTVRRADHRQPSSRAANSPLRGLLLLIFFAWAFVYLVTYIGWVTAPWGPWS
jgi:hypothetical protein